MQRRKPAAAPAGSWADGAQRPTRDQPEKKQAPLRGPARMRGIGGLVPRLSGCGRLKGSRDTLNCYVSLSSVACGIDTSLERSSHVHPAHAARPAALPPWLCSSSFGASATMTSVVSRRPATEAAFCSARRSPWSDRGCPLPACRRTRHWQRCSRRALTFLDTVQDHRGILASVVDDLAQRLLDRARAGCECRPSGPHSRPRACRAPSARGSGHAAAGHDALLDRRRVACSASSTRAFFSFISIRWQRRP